MTKYDKEFELFMDNVDYYRKIVGLTWKDLFGGNTHGYKNRKIKPRWEMIVTTAKKLGLSVQALFDDIGTITLETAYKLVADDLGVSERELRKMIKKMKLANKFCRDWRE